MYILFYPLYISIYIFTFLYLQCPTTEKEWRKIASDFWQLWNFPNCIGALDGKHVIIRQPACTGSMYFNYKHSFSVILLALVDAHYRFLFIDIGAQGRCADSGVFNESDLNEALLRNTLNVPSPTPLPGTNDYFPFVIVADDAFPLREGIMKPYPHRNLEGTQRIYNYRLSRARRCVENAFGILANRFRVMLSPMCVRPETVDKVVIAACTLHNMLRTIAPEKYILPRESSTGNAQYNKMASANVASRRSATRNGKQLRDVLCEYFLSPEGAVAWQ